MKKLLIVMVVAALTAANASAAYSLFGVDDQEGSGTVSGAGDSQFFTADCWSNSSTEVGPLYVDYDIEAIDAQTLGGTIYAVSGAAGTNNYQLHTVTVGGVLSAGTSLSLSNEAQGGSFMPGTSHLWISIQNGGISYIDVANSNTITPVTASGNLEGLAWENDSTLYGITDAGLLTEYGYDGSTLSAAIRSVTLAGTSYEGLDFDPDGNLIVAKGNLMYQVDLTSANFGDLALLATYNSSVDVESFTFIPEPATMVLLGLGGLLLRRRRA